ncbi:MAG: hypothetical protein V3W34_14835 [Phycisphaerae bacterium]
MRSVCGFGSCTNRWRIALVTVTALVVGMGLAVSSADGGIVTLDNGLPLDTDGRLEVQVDDYGSFANGFGPPDQPDLFDPSPAPVEPENPMGPEAPTFATTIFLFIDPSTVGNGTHRGAFSGHEAGYIDTYDDGNLIFEVKQENSTDNLPVSTNSVINVTGPGGVELEVSVTQTVTSLTPGPAAEERAQLEQTYRFKNTGNQTREWIIVKHIDEDMPWGGGGSFHLDDLVGADFAELGRVQVYAQDRDLTTAAMVLRTRDNHDPDPDLVDEFGVVPNSVDFIYYCAKQTITPRDNQDYPGGRCPAYGFGTDFFIWDNYGAPNCWKNNVPRVGHDVPGLSPQLSGDSHIGLQVEARIAPGSTYEISYITIYGFRPEPTTKIPPAFETRFVEFDPNTGCGEFLWSLQNINPIIPTETPLPISEFFIDVEVGDGQLGGCFNMEAPPGWTAERCDVDTLNGHALYRFFGGTQLELGDQAVARLTVQTNGNEETTDPVTGVVVPLLSVVLHAAQAQLDPDENPFPCDLAIFGPQADGGWSSRIIATAFVPVPSLSAWAKVVLSLIVVSGGALLVLRSRRSASA